MPVVGTLHNHNIRNWYDLMVAPHALVSHKRALLRIGTHLFNEVPAPTP